jgi:hypothetical protein
MKTTFAVLALAFSSLSFAQSYSHYDVIKKLDAFEGKTGTGSLVVKGKTVAASASCYSFVNNVDVWSSEETVTADYFAIHISSEEVGTDLQGWDPKDVTIEKLAGATRYTNKFISTKKCSVVEVLTIAKKSVSFSEKVNCDDRRFKVTDRLAVCNF